jgi:CBS domain-containing protein
MSSAPLVTVHPETPLLEAERMMTAHHVRRLPVTTHDGIVTAVITQADMADTVTPRAVVQTDDERASFRR